MSAATVSFLGYLVYQLPSLRPVLDEHLADQDGEILSHVLMADIERWAEKQIAAPARQELGRLFELLEDSWISNDPEITELISVSFLEHLPRPDEPGAELRSLAGPGLSRQLDVIG